MEHRDPKALIAELQNVEVKLPKHQRELRERLLEVHAEQTSLFRRLLAKGRMRWNSGHPALGFHRLAPLVGMIVMLIGLVIAGILMFLSSGRPAPGQKLIVSVAKKVDTKGSSYSTPDPTAWQCSSGGCSVINSGSGATSGALSVATSGSSAPHSAGIGQKNSGSGNSSSASDSTVTSSPNQLVSLPASPPPVLLPTQPVVAISTPADTVDVSVSVATDSNFPGNSGNAPGHSDKATKDNPGQAKNALTKALKNLGL